MSPQLVCTSCGASTPIGLAQTGGSKRYAINRRSVLANKCVGGTHTNLSMFLAVMELPPPLSRNAYSENLRETCEIVNSAVPSSMTTACDQVCNHYDAAPNDVIDILVSWDGTWQKHGHSSLFGAVFVIAYETGKVLKYTVFSKHCVGCKLWDNKDKYTQEYQAWKKAHAPRCTINFTGSAGAMEPQGTLMLFKRSLSHGLCY